ncbi:hypothetical protein HK097_003957 [Rhizophlyctis rosea]|uniref:Uncharacterized protein n=1 Tax=Rhizophlyctis rosea TaxID=64517 RepID=A0AAD5WZA4_9FUNG|nr:hypothetical protein HK097_003957 [Rhizophlyctis rosea]
MSTRVLFMHGSGGGPNDNTATYLCQHYTCRTPQMDPSDLSAAVNIQRTVLKEFQPDVIVGESFGAAVAYQLMEEGCWNGPAVFMCPAVHHIRTRFGLTSEPIIPANVPLVILHGTKDDKIPLDHSQRLQKNAKTPETVKLHMVDDDHWMKGVVERKELGSFVDEAVEAGRGH